MQNTINLYKGDKMADSINVRIDPEKHRKFKTCATMNGETISQIIMRTVDKYIEESEKKMG